MFLFSIEILSSYSILNFCILIEILFPNISKYFSISLLINQKFRYSLAVMEWRHNNRASRTNKDMRTGSHHVFRMEGRKTIISLILIIKTAFLFDFAIEEDCFNLVIQRKSNILLTWSSSETKKLNFHDFLVSKVFMLE